MGWGWGVAVGCKQRDKPWPVQLTRPLQPVEGRAGEETLSSSFFFARGLLIAWSIIRGIFGLSLIQVGVAQNPKSSSERWRDASILHGCV